MIKIITKSEKDLFLRPGVDELFYDKTGLDSFFRALMMEEAEDLININLTETAHEYFLNSKNIWYLKTEEENTYLKIVLSDFETDPITEDYLNNLIFENEEGLIEVVNNLSDIKDFRYMNQMSDKEYDNYLEDLEVEDEHFKNITG